jgi:outer membrane protein assembly factor BamB
VSAIPAVVAGGVYVPDWGGYLNKVDAATGTTIWSRPISDYDGVSGSVSRAAPAVVGNSVYLGDGNGGYLFAVNATTGAPIWTTRVDQHPLAILTGTPYTIPGGQTITSGSWAALDPATGKILSQVPDPSHQAFGGGNALGPSPSPTASYTHHR